LLYRLRNLRLKRIWENLLDNGPVIVQITCLVEPVTQRDPLSAGLTAGTWFIGVQYNQNSSVSTTDPASASIHFQQAFTGPGGRDSYIGPNFQILTTPEPATIYLISISLGLAALLRRKRP
jgi:hypothetical protein